MSPSAGIVQRLITVFTSRWFIAIMIPLPGMISTPSIPAMSAIWPAQAPDALSDHPGLDGDLLAAVLVVQARADHGVALAQHVHDRVVGQDRRAAAAGRVGERPHGLPGVDARRRER